MRASETARMARSIENDLSDGFLLRNVGGTRVVGGTQDLYTLQVVSPVSISSTNMHFYFSYVTLLLYLYVPVLWICKYFFRFCIRNLPGHLCGH
jgi:hypothetical protein